MIKATAFLFHLTELYLLLVGKFNVHQLKYYVLKDEKCYMIRKLSLFS